MLYWISLSQRSSFKFFPRHFIQSLPSHSYISISPPFVTLNASFDFGKGRYFYRKQLRLVVDLWSPLIICNRKFVIRTVAIFLLDLFAIEWMCAFLWAYEHAQVVFYFRHSSMQKKMLSIGNSPPPTSTIEDDCCDWCVSFREMLRIILPWDGLIGSRMFCK